MVIKELGEIIELQRGYDLTSSQMAGGNVPVAGSNGIIGYHNIARTDEISITIGRSGTIGKVNYYSKPIWPHNTSLFVTNFHNNNKRYLYYLLKTIDYKKVCDSSVIPSLNRNFVYPIKVKFEEDLETQRKIAAVLTALDDKIALNRRMNAKLEAMAKRLYDYWFVQFDFPNENGRPYKSSGGKMVWNEQLKREIPAGWEVKRLGEMCSKITDGEHNTVIDDPNGDCYLLSCKNIKNNSIIFNETDRRIDRDTYNKIHQRTNLQKGDVLMSSVGTIGETCILLQDLNNIEFQRSVAILKPNNNISSYYLYHFINTNKSYIKTKGHGAVQKCVFISDIECIVITKPNKKIINKFDLHQEPIMKMVSESQLEISRLTSLRDRLLPLLMNGQVEVG